ncbi:MAG: prepilin-type N-terminal cleavage/methylation domain-containing protein, partial [Lachnospiraceae bacterium]
MKEEKVFRRKKQLNNKGMSLVEVLIAMVILAIVVGPLLRTFVFSIQLSNRSKEQQRITTAAQSIMEGFKAYSVQELCEQFNAGSSKVVSNAGSVQELAVSDHTGDGVADVSIIGGEFVPSLTNSYAFELCNVKFEDAYYDAKVEVSVDSSKIITVQDVSTIEDMNAYRDAVYKQGADMDSKVYQEILTRTASTLSTLSGETVSATEVDADKIEISSKVTTISIEQGASATINIVKVTTAYTYKVVGHPYKIGETEYSYDLSDTILYIDEDGNVTD